MRNRMNTLVILNDDVSEGDGLQEDHHVIDDDEILVFLTSFNGAEYLRTRKYSSSVISFNISVLASSLLTLDSKAELDKMTPTSSRNMLTFQQLRDIKKQVWSYHQL